MRKTILSLLLASTALSRLVVYGPQELKDKFEFSGNHYTNTRLYIEFKIPANFANFGHIPYGQSMVSNQNLNQNYIDRKNLLQPVECGWLQQKQLHE